MLISFECEFESVTFYLVAIDFFDNSSKIGRKLRKTFFLLRKVLQMFISFIFNSVSTFIFLSYEIEVAHANDWFRYLMHDASTHFVEAY